MKKVLYMILTLILSFYFNNIFISANTEDVGCTYSMSKKDGAQCIGSFLEDFIKDDSTFTTTIFFSKKGELESSDLSPLTLGGYSIGYTNNLSSLSAGLYPGLKNEDEDVSAADYYEAQGCPPYFTLHCTMDCYGYFASKKDGWDTCVFPLERKEYDDNLNQKDEEYNCNLYSSDLYFKDYSINININYTKKTMNYGNESSDSSEQAIAAIKSYKENFDYATKNKCPVNELKVCVNLNYIFVYPKDYDNPVVNDCAVLDSSKKLEVGDNYCNFVVDSSKELKNFEKKNQDFYSKLFVLKNFCNSVLKNNDYDSYKLSCTNMCLNINDHIPSDTFLNSECGISEKLMLFIANIVKWLKYIIPVIVIVLGILDFLKAISADKEDEMKKTQKRFIIRLIAAALIFIIPFIIEFVLNKMGFTANGCGIIDL